VIVLKWFYWRWLQSDRRHYSMAEATGLGPGVGQWEVPHTASNFIMKEMGYEVARAHGTRLQRFVILLLASALALMLLSTLTAWLVAASVAATLLAAWTERWLYFAQAEHVVGLFYGKDRV
jgi:hypothetical protein